MKDYYYILGIERTARITEIKQAYRKLSLKFHPDKNDGDKFFEARFREIHEAYHILSDNNKRQDYDEAFINRQAKEPSQTSSDSTKKASPPVILRFTADKTTIHLGEKLTFEWDITYATSAELVPFGVVPTNGKKTVIVHGFNDKGGLKVELRAKGLTNQIVRNKIFLNKKDRSIELRDVTKRFIIGWFFVFFLSFFLYFGYEYYTKENQSIEPESLAIGTTEEHSNRKSTYGDEYVFEPDRNDKYDGKQRARSFGKVDGSGSRENGDKIDTTEDQVYIVVEQQPEFPGGIAALGQYLQENLRYPATAQQANISGRVFLSFVINTDGSVQDVQVLKGLGFGTDEEAKRVVEGMPKWLPGEQSGKPVRVKFNLPINFTLE